MFEIPDPLSKLDRSMSMIGGGFQPRAEYRKPFSPEEMRPLTQQLLDYGQSGLRTIFHGLSAPGDYTRGALAGKLGQRVTGRQLTDQWGVTDRNDKGWGAWGLGLGADVASDPLTYATFGAKHAFTPLGKALSKTGELNSWGRKSMLGGFHATENELLAAGRSAEEIAHLKRGGMIPGLNEVGNSVPGLQAGPWRVASSAQDAIAQKALGRPIQTGERLSGLAGFGLPFMGPKFTIGGGRIGQGIAGALDFGADKALYKIPGMKTVSALFDPRVMGALDEPSQRGFRAGGYEAFQKMQAQARGHQAEMAGRLEPVLQQFPGKERDVLHAARALGENATRARLDPAIVSAAEQHLGSGFPDWYRGVLKQFREAGVDTQDWKNAENLNYMRREPLYGNKDVLQPKYSIYPTHMSFDQHREAMFGQAGGSPRVDEWAMRYAGSQAPVRQTQRGIFRDMVDDAMEKASMTGPPMPLAKPRLNEMRDQARKLAEWTKGISGAHVANHEPFFDPDLVGNVGNYGYMAGRKLAAASGLHGAIAHAAVPMSPGMMATHYSVPEFLRQVKGFDTHLKDKSLGIPQIHGSMAEILKELAPKGAPPAERLLGMRTRKPLIQELGKFGVPKDMLDAVKRSYAKAQAPEQLSAPLKAYDSISNMFKALAYPIFPASHAKNATTAAINLLRTDTPAGALKSVIEQAKMLREPGMGSAATSAERASQFTHGNVGSGFDSLNELAGMNTPTKIRQGDRITMSPPLSGLRGPTGTLAGDVVHLIGVEGVGKTLGNTANAAYQIAKKPWSPSRWHDAIASNLGIKGVGSMERDALPAVRAGRIGSMNIENLFRGAQMKSLARQDYLPAEAARLMNKYQFDYGSLTDFEKNVGRRVFPFYTFMRKNIPMQVETMATKPGISMAQMYPAYQERHQNPYIPDYLSGNLSIPLGPGSEPGHQKFIGSLGLPIEEAFSRFKMKGGMLDLPGTLMGFAGNMNPLIKWPLEQTFDRQLFSGRSLSDLKAPQSMKMIGRMFGDENPQFLSEFMANTPFTRFMTTADRIMDPRKTLLDKALNLTTGAKVTDVDVPKQQAIEARNALGELLSQSSHLSTYPSWYVKPEARGQLTQEEVMRMRELATQEKAARDYVKERNRRGSGIGIQSLSGAGQ